MKREKKPMPKNGDCAYPSLRQSKFDRRRFLALLGGGVAGSTVFAACYESGNGARGSDAGTDTGSAIDTGTDTGSAIDTGSDSETIDTGWDTNEMIAGDPPAPDFFQRRLPGNDFQVAYLGDGSEVVYAVATVFEEPLFGQLTEADLLAEIDRALRASHSNIADFETEEGLELVEKSVKEALTQACLDEHGAEPSFIEVTFVVERLRRNEPIAGDVADSDLGDTDSGIGW